MKTAVVIIGVCGLLAFAAGQVGAMEALQTLPLSGALHATYRPAKCPKGTPAMTDGSVTPCYLAIAHGTIRGLGTVTDRRIAVLLHSTTKCMQVKQSVVLTVTARGTVGANAATQRCVDPQADVKIIPFRITGGTSAFAGATGSGTITISTAGAGYGFETETWKGRLTLPR